MATRRMLMLGRFLVALALGVSVLSLALPSWGAVAHVQSKHAVACCSQTSILVTTDSNVTAGNLLALWIFSDSNQEISTITGCQSNTFTLAGSQAYTDGMRSWGYYAQNITGGACAITVTMAASTSLLRVVVAEISGAATSGVLDTFSSNSQINPGTGTDAVTTGAQTTTTDGQYIFAVTAATAGTTSITAGTTPAFTSRQTDSTNYMAEEHIQTTGGSIDGAWTIGTTAAFQSLMMTFKAAGAAAAAPRRGLLGVGR